jgi:hypothetical protein
MGLAIDSATSLFFYSTEIGDSVQALVFAPIVLNLFDYE